MNILSQKLGGARNRWRSSLADRELRRQIGRVEQALRDREGLGSTGDAPVLFFNASTRIHRLSLNAAFGLLASWAIRWEGVPVRYLVCRQGMSQCILGTNRQYPAAAPPCRRCMGFSDLLYPTDKVIPLSGPYLRTTTVDCELEGKSLAELATWEHAGLPLGDLCLPGLRWALRRHRLQDDEPTRRLMRQYLASAAALADKLERIYERVSPRALVVFNGIFYPEAVARQVALRRKIPVVTHEVGLRPFSAFFSHGHATFRQVDLPPGFDLTPEQEQSLNHYLEARFRGDFTMAGVRFWPEMRALPEWLVERMGQYRQTVTVFTNVAFDTSQVHANVLYEDMFEWLEDVRNATEGRGDTFFVIRAHPDEDRPGKESQESVAEWVRQGGLNDCPNVAFFSPTDPVSSYELVRRSKFVMVYNSSVGLEASIMGAPVLCAGRARYTQVPTVFFPASRQAYLGQLEAFLKAEEIAVPPENARNGRRFLYFELYRASLDLSHFLKPDPVMAGMTLLTPFEPSKLGNSNALGVIRDGILSGKEFLV